MEVACLTEMGRTEEALAAFKLLVAKFPIEDEGLLAYAKAMRGRDAFNRAAAR